MGSLEQKTVYKVLTANEPILAQRLVEKLQRFTDSIMNKRAVVACCLFTTQDIIKKHSGTYENVQKFHNATLILTNTYISKDLS